jgi:uncharacterized membrane protein (UPF0136 family)
MGGLGDLLRPPPHRGPLIAAGTVALAVGIALEELRLRHAFGLGPHAAILLAAGALAFWLGAQAPNEDGAPPAYQSVLLVTGLAELYAGLLTLADAVGMAVDVGDGSGIIVPSLVIAGAALWAALRRASAICLLIGVVLGALAVVATWHWLAGDHHWVLRVLLALMAAAFALASLGLRQPAPRHAQQLVNAAGLATLAIVLTGIAFDDKLSGFWQAVLLGAGFGLLAYAALDRAPGPAYLGVLNLVAFVVSAADAHTLYWWPLVLLGAGGLMLAAGLRPRRPLPPEPPGYKAGEAPLAARAEEDEMVFRVRDD